VVFDIWYCETVLKNLLYALYIPNPIFRSTVTRMHKNYL
jgi:hypothetical protein